MPDRKVIPRCRTMIEPDVTSWPSPRLTPSRWPTLSRPFLELEPAFLWAIGLLVLLGVGRPLRGRGARLGRLGGLGVRGLGGGLRGGLGRARLRVGLGVGLGRGL